jgi:hypothetical protein
MEEHVRLKKATTCRKAKSPVVSDTDAPILPAGSAALSWIVPSS